MFSKQHSKDAVFGERRVSNICLPNKELCYKSPLKLLRVPLLPNFWRGILPQLYKWVKVWGWRSLKVWHGSTFHLLSFFSLFLLCFPKREGGNEGMVTCVEESIEFLALSCFPRCFLFLWLKLVLLSDVLLKCRTQKQQLFGKSGNTNSFHFLLIFLFFKKFKYKYRSVLWYYS